MSLWALALLAGVLLGAALVGFTLQRRQRRQLNALAERLDELELRWLQGGARLSDERESVRASLPAPRLAPEPASAEEGALEESTAVAPTADVLAGLTSHVQALLSRGSGGVEVLADRAILAIYERLAEPLSPSVLASTLYVSLRTLERGLTVALDCTPGELIATVRMREARRLLAGGCRVSEVAERLGFADAFHFSRRFKRFYGLAPSEARRPPRLAVGRSS